MSWGVDPEVLIIEVESRPLLYAKSLKEYSNKTLKKNAWKDLTKKLSEDWETLTNEERNIRCNDIQAKWKHLRDNFRREYQAQKDVTSRQGAKKRKKYRYYDDLLFLVPHVKDAQTSGNYGVFPLSAETEQTTESSSIPNIENSAGPSTATRETPKKRKKNTSAFEDAVLKAIRNEVSGMDEDKTFCLSLVQSLKKMDDDNKMLAKIEILNVIRTFSNRARNTSNSEPDQSPFNRPNIEPYNFSHPNSNLSLQSTPIYTKIPQQQYSQSTLIQARNTYQEHTESHPTPSMYQSSSVNPVHQSKVKIIKNRQYRPANSTGHNSRPHSI